MTLYHFVDKKSFEVCEVAYLSSNGINMLFRMKKFTDILFSKCKHYLAWTKYKHIETAAQIQESNPS